MSDLHHVLPDAFPAHRFSHLLPSLDRHRVTTSDILTLDAPDLARRAQVPVAELRKLQDAIVTALHADLGVSHPLASESGKPGATDAWHATEWRTISTLDDRLDAELGGGVPAGYLTEITGESGAGKTQLLLTLLLSAQLPPPHGLSKSALYISTEAPLATPRLTQLLNQHPRLSNLAPSSKPSLSRILSIQVPDLESQDHILRYQLPVAIQRHAVGLVVIDSVAANYRAEFERGSSRRAIGEAHAKQAAQLVQLGALLRAVAHTHNIAVIAANQVADRFSSSDDDKAPPPPPPPASTPAAAASSRHPSYNSAHSQASRVPTPGPPTPTAAAASLSLSPEPLALDHQQRWFTGWGDVRPSSSSSSSSSSQNLKTPALGLPWTNQIAARVALLKAPVYNSPTWVGLAADGRADWRDDGGGEEGGVEIRRWRRWLKVVFAPWAAPSRGRGVEFVVRGSGVAATSSVEAEKEEREARGKAVVGEVEEEEETKEEEDGK